MQNDVQEKLHYNPGRGMWTSKYSYNNPRFRAKYKPAILELLKVDGTITPKELRRHLGLPPRHYRSYPSNERRALNRLVEQGILLRTTFKRKGSTIYLSANCAPCFLKALT